MVDALFIVLCNLISIYRIDHRKILLENSSDIIVLHGWTMHGSGVPDLNNFAWSSFTFHNQTFKFKVCLLRQPMLTLPCKQIKWQ